MEEVKRTAQTVSIKISFNKHSSFWLPLATCALVGFIRRRCRRSSFSEHIKHFKLSLKLSTISPLLPLVWKFFATSKFWLSISNKHVMSSAIMWHERERRAYTNFWQHMKAWIHQCCALEKLWQGREVTSGKKKQSSWHKSSLKVYTKTLQLLCCVFYCSKKRRKVWSDCH